MTSAATRLRDAVYDRVSTTQSFAKASKVGFPQLQSEQLPYCGVFISREVMTPDGDGNIGDLRFNSEVTIALLMVRGFAETADLDTLIEGDVERIESALFCDPTFTQFGPDALFESVSRIDRRRAFQFQGETYTVELRIEITFAVRVGFEPRIVDDYRGLDMTTRPSGFDNAPAIHTRIDNDDA